MSTHICIYSLKYVSLYIACCVLLVYIGYSICIITIIVHYVHCQSIFQYIEFVDFVKVKSKLEKRIIPSKYMIPMPIYIADIYIYIYENSFYMWL